MLESSYVQPWLSVSAAVTAAFSESLPNLKSAKVALARAKSQIDLRQDIHKVTNRHTPLKNSLIAVHTRNKQRHVKCVNC